MDDWGYPPLFLETPIYIIQKQGDHVVNHSTCSSKPPGVAPLLAPNSSLPCTGKFTEMNQSNIKSDTWYQTIKVITADQTFPHITFSSLTEKPDLWLPKKNHQLEALSFLSFESKGWNHIRMPGNLKVSPKDSLNDGHHWKVNILSNKQKGFLINLPQYVIKLMQILPPKKDELPSRPFHSPFSNHRLLPSKSIDFSQKKVTSLMVSTFAEAYSDGPVWKIPWEKNMQLEVQKRKNWQNKLTWQFCWCPVGMVKTDPFKA